MKVGGIVLIFLPMLVAAQQLPEPSPNAATDRANVYLHQFLATDGQQGTETLDKVDELIELFEGKRTRFKHDEDFVGFLFTKTHARLLKRYVDYPSFGELVGKGNYNCLTATALYAVLLQHFGYEFEVVETNYHIFLVARINGKRVLLESTDPLNGFVTDQREVDNRIKIARQPTLVASSSKKSFYYQFSFDLFNSISIDQIPGLLYYNESVKAFNEQSLVHSVAQLENAVAVYESPRIIEFAGVVSVAVEQSSLEQAVKEACLKKLIQIQRRTINLLASN